MKERVLVYGAGVIGSVYALRLAKAGYPVTVLARGERLKDIRAGGIRIRNVFLDDEEHADVDLRESLPPDADFDIVILTLRSGQILEALRGLPALPQARAIFVVGNNLEDLGAEEGAAGAGRFVLGFGAFGGYREGDVIVYTDGRTKVKREGENRSKTTLGLLSDAARPALEAVRSVLESAGLPCVESRAMDDWLVCHAALVFPLAGAIYATGGDQARLSRTRDAIILAIRACKEAFAALRASGFEVEPPSFKKLLAMPEWLLLRVLSKSLSSEGARVAMFGHAMAPGGHGEVGGQAKVLDLILKKAGKPLPHWERLLPWFDPSGAPEPIPDGERKLRLRIW